MPSDFKKDKVFEIFEGSELMEMMMILNNKEIMIIQDD
jgi:hypothetical protein